MTKLAVIPRKPAFADPADAGAARRAREDAVLAEAESIFAKRYMRQGQTLDVAGAKAWLKLHLGTVPYEVFGLVHLDQRHRIIQTQDLFCGTINGATVVPREVVAECFKHNSAAVVLYHQHPSGDSTPSVADDMLTSQIKQALAMIEVRVIDHIVVGETPYSFAEHGKL